MITILTHALITILICGLIVWLINFVPIESRFKMIARVIVVVLALVEIMFTTASRRASPPRLASRR